jgi:hypothetical protein
MKVKANGTRNITVGRESEIDLTHVHFQEEGQLRLIAFLLQHMAKNYRKNNPTLSDLVESYNNLIQTHRSFDYFTPFKTGSLTAVRPFELAAVLNRYRALQIAQNPVLPASSTRP